MSHRDDQIKILDLVCAGMLPADFDFEKLQEVTIYEDELKQEGFSYYGGINLIKEMYEVIPKINLVTTPEGKRGICMSVNNDVYSLLSILKYPHRDLEEKIEQYEIDSAFTEIPQKVSIKIDDKKGIYQTKNPEYCYPLNSESQRMKIIKYVLAHEKSGIANLRKETMQSDAVISQEIKRINQTFKLKLRVNHDLIIHLKVRGYCLNKEFFDIV
jgi:hypothetical protein